MAQPTTYQQSTTIMLLAGYTSVGSRNVSLTCCSQACCNAGLDGCWYWNGLMLHSFEIVGIQFLILKDTISCVHDDLIVIKYVDIFSFQFTTPCCIPSVGTNYM